MSNTVKIKRADAIRLLNYKGHLQNSDGEDVLFYADADEMKNEKLAKCLTLVSESEGADSDVELDDNDVQATYSAIVDAFDHEPALIIEVYGDDEEEAPAKKTVKGKKAEVVEEEDDDAPRKPVKKGGKKTAKKPEAKQAKAALKKPEKKKTNIAKPEVKKAKRVQKERGISLVDAAAQLLKETKAAMTPRAMVDALAARKLWTSIAATPDRTLSTAIIREIRGETKQEKPRFVHVDRGMFTAAGVKYTPVEKEEKEKPVKKTGKKAAKGKSGKSSPKSGTANKAKPGTAKKGTSSKGTVSTKTKTKTTKAKSGKAAKGKTAK